MYQKVCEVQNVILSFRPLKSVYLYMRIGVTVAYLQVEGLDDHALRYAFKIFHHLF